MMVAARFTSLVSIAVLVSFFQVYLLRIILAADTDPNYVGLLLIFSIAPILVSWLLLFFAAREWRTKVWAFGTAAVIFALWAVASYLSEFNDQAIVRIAGVTGERAEMLIRASDPKILGHLCSVLSVAFVLGASMVYGILIRFDVGKTAADASRTHGGVEE